MRTSEPLRAILAGALTLLVMASVVALGQIPWGSPTGSAVLRLALRTTRGQVEVCRQRTAEELEALPVHMRQPEVCERHPVPYHLIVALDGRTLIEETVGSGGLRGDRAHSVDREVDAPPGRARLEVRFSPVLESGAAAQVRGAFGELSDYRLERRVSLRADRVTLVFLDEDVDRLVVEGGD